MEKKVICLPEKSAKNTKLESFIFNGRSYVFDTKNNEILEMVACRSENSCWFIDNFVEQDGSLTMLTPVDVTYLILPALIENPKGFRCLRDLLSEKEESWEFLHRCCVENELQNKAIDGENYMKFNCEKTLEWLKCKVKLVQNALIENQVSSSSKCVKVSGFVSGREEAKSEGDLLRYATELVLQYIPDDLGTQLMNYLNVDVIEKDDKNVTDEKNVLKRNHSSKAVEDYFDDSETQKKQDTKKPKLSKTQRELEKHKRGTKSISNFFKPKVTK